MTRMFVDVQLNLPWATPESLGKRHIYPVAAVKCLQFEDQLETWLLRSGLLTIDEIAEAPSVALLIESKFKFVHKGAPLQSMDPLDQADEVDVIPAADPTTFSGESVARSETKKRVSPENTE